MTGNASKQSAIAKEHGMDFISVLRSYAEAGYGIDTTAKIIGYEPANLRRLLKRHNNFGITWPTFKEQYAAGCLDNGGPDAYARRGKKISEYHVKRKLQGLPHPNGKFKSKS